MQYGKETKTQRKNSYKEHHLYEGYSINIFKCLYAWLFADSSVCIIHIGCTCLYSVNRRMKMCYELYELGSKFFKSVFSYVFYSYTRINKCNVHICFIHDSTLWKSWRLDRPCNSLVDGHRWSGSLHLYMLPVILTSFSKVEELR